MMKVNLFCPYLSQYPNMFLSGIHKLEDISMEWVEFLLRGEVALFCVGVLIGGYAALLLTWPRRGRGGRG